MARLFTSGFEICNPGLVATASPDNPSALGVAGTRSTVNPRSGLAAARVTNAVGPIAGAGPILANKTYFARGYMSFSSLPATTQAIISANGVDVRLTAAGKVQLFRTSAGTQIGSDSTGTVVAGAYSRYEISIVTDASTFTTAVELRLEGGAVASTTGLSVGAAGTNFSWSGLTGAGITSDLDDLAVNDSTGAANNTWPGDGKVLLMRPISDNNRGVWTQGAGVGGTTNLFDAVNNTPPVGVLDASATATTQIKNRTATNPSNYDGNLATYLAAGIGASDTINAILLWAFTGEDPATGTKAGTISMVSNPAIGPSASFNFGNDIGLQGTWPSNWFASSTVHADAPTVTKASAPVIRITCTSGATTARSASCCFLGAYVDYTPFVAGAALAPPERVALQGVNRAAVM